jgi:hypothetical protein
MEEPKSKETKKFKTKEEKDEYEKTELLSRLSHNNLTDINSKVAFVLNHFPNTRNSDINLITRFWKIFDEEILGGADYITFDQMYKVTRSNSIIRARAKIQNSYGLFLANEKVRRRRAELDDDERVKQVEDQPGAPLVSVFCDESGKNQNYLLIGSVWINDPYRVFKIYQSLTDWKEENKIDYEFHFSDLNKYRVSKAIEFIQQALSQSDALAFKAAIIAKGNIGSRNQDEAIYDLHYQLIVQGFEHELKSKRLDLPRQVSLTKDKDDGADKIRLAGLRQKLSSECVSYFKDQIHIAAVETEDSGKSVFLQLVDLFSGSISRILNKTDDSMNHKDELANEVIKLLGIDKDLKVDTNKQDFVEIIHIE